MRQFNAIFLVIGTAIGAGMLGMPVEMGKGGFFPGFFALIITWFFSVMSGLFFLKALSHVKQGANFLTLSESILSKSSRVYIVFLYLLLFLSLLFAYVKGGGVFVSESVTGISIPFGTLCFVLFFLPFLIGGHSFVGLINSILAMLLAVSFVCLISMGHGEVNYDLLSRQNWNKTFSCIPLLVTSFGFQGVIPSLYNYLEGNEKEVMRSIILGSLFVLVVYILWNGYILGIVPLNGDVSLASASLNDQTAISPLCHFLGSSKIALFARVFYFCALTTSFLGVSISLMDFLKDALKLEHNLKTRAKLSFVLFIPALFLSGTSLRIFYLSLKYGAGITAIILLLLFPASLVFMLKRKQSHENHLRSL